MFLVIRNFRNDFANILQECKNDTALLTIDPNNDENIISMSYEKLNTIIKQIGAFLKKNNVNEGDDILCILPNSIELAAIFLCCMYNGINLISLPCDTTSNNIKEIFDILNPKLSLLSKIILNDSEIKQNFCNKNHVAINVDACFNWLCTEEYEYSGSLAYVYISTSGTTGKPKLMMLNINKLWSSGFYFLRYHNLENKKLRFWNYLPMSYLGGLFNLLLIPLIAKGAALIGQTFSGKTYLNFWHTVNRFNINAIWFTPSIVKGLATFGERYSEEERFYYSRNIIASFLGTAPIKLDIKQKFEKQFNIKLLENFALSETTFFTSENPKILKYREEASVGEILSYTQVKIKNLKNGCSEIYVKTPFLFEGYLTEQGFESPKVDDLGFFATSDLGYINKNNNLVIQGRNRDIIKKGGYFISLREIELIAEDIDGIKEAACVKIAHDFYGESYNLYIISNNNTSKEVLSQKILAKLIKYKWPEEIILKKAFPKTNSGKIKKQELIGIQE